jgi:hypothetical protein
MVRENVAFQRERSPADASGVGVLPSAFRRFCRKCIAPILSGAHLGV